MFQMLLNAPHTIAGSSTPRTGMSPLTVTQLFIITHLIEVSYYLVQKSWPQQIYTPASNRIGASLWTMILDVSAGRPGFDSRQE